mgnify:CR=1 FL=1
MANNKEKTVTFTVAECSEFHNMGEFYEGITNVADAIEKTYSHYYEKDKKSKKDK